jgi:hypothetical protein
MSFIRYKNKKKREEEQVENGRSVKTGNKEVL